MRLNRAEINANYLCRLSVTRYLWENMSVFLIPTSAAGWASAVPHVSLLKKCSESMRLTKVKCPHPRTGTNIEDSLCIFGTRVEGWLSIELDFPDVMLQI